MKAGLGGSDCIRVLLFDRASEHMGHEIHSEALGTWESIAFRSVYMMFTAT